VAAGLLADYHGRIAAGTLRPDPAQEAVAARLEALAAALAAAPAEPKPDGLLGRIGLARAATAPPPPRGLYLHGAVGCGKSMLMDMFFEHAPVGAKRRVHFHEFMLEVQRRLHEQRRVAAAEEPIAPVAQALAAEARLLCFDEFTVFNIADAMILGRLFEGLLERGVVVVATSNLPPERLYEGGLNRDRFLPFIDLLKARLEVVALESIDYRRARLRDMALYHHPLGAETDTRLEEAFAALTDGAGGEAEELAVGSRRLLVPRAAKGVAWFGFAELCERPLGAADYLALTDRYDTVILGGVPVLTPDRRNEARRLITLVDALYERRIKLVIGAAAPADALHAGGEGAFEFQRTASRLLEMQTLAYLESAKTAERPAAELFAFALTSDLT
jgi:cell division protein ZapE